MSNRLLHTVEGLRDLHPMDTAKKTVIGNSILNNFSLFGYEQVQTPTFEYFDIYRNERGTSDSKNLYKFFNREGDILALRPDVTPSIARYMATFYNHVDTPRRFCYLGNVFYNNENYQGKLREYTQAGVECIGFAGADSDAECIALSIQSLLSTGLVDFQIDIGHAGFFNGLSEEAGFDIEVQEEVRLLIDEKNYIALEALLNDLHINETTKAGLLALPTLFGQEEVLERAKLLTHNEMANKAIQRLKEIFEILKEYAVEKYITFDFGMVSKLQYYTGLIFKGYTYDVGDSIVDGGRYDNLLSTFSHQAPAVGFAVKVDEVLSALTRQKISIDVPTINTLLSFNEAHRKTAVSLARILRKSGMTVELGMNELTKEESIRYGKEKSIGGLMFLVDQDTVQLVNLSTDEETEAKLSDLIEGGI
jgi:ATP phosphoribosyltransferase regulatory subunit